MDKLRRKREREHRAQSEIRCGVAPKRARRLKKQIGKSTLRGQDEGIPGGGAYPFPGDLRAKFAWKEANRLSRGELIDNTAVTCSNLDRRPTLIPPLLLPSPSPSLLRYPPIRFAVPSNFGEIHFIYLDRRAILRSLTIPQSRIYPPEFRDSTHRMCVIPSVVWTFRTYTVYQASSQKRRSESYR